MPCRLVHQGTSLFTIHNKEKETMPKYLRNYDKIVVESLTAEIYKSLSMIL